MIWPVNIWLGMLAVGLFIRLGLRFLYGARGPDKGDGFYATAHIASIVLLTIALLIPIVAASGTYIGAILIIFAAATFVEAVTLRRAAQRRSICKLLALAMSHSAQPESSLLIAGQSFRGTVGRAARRLVDELRHGTPFAAAVRREPKALPPEALAYIAAGPTNEARAAALNELSRADRSPIAAVWRTFIDRVTYLLCVLLVMVLIVTFVLISIAPKFEDIFSDFGLELPYITQIVLAISEYALSYVAAPLAILILIGIIAAFVIGICYLVDKPVLKPIADRLLRGRRYGDVLRILAVAAETRQPLSPVLDRLALVYPSRMLRRRLAKAAATIDAGNGWLQALRDGRLVTQAEQALLSTAEKVGNLPWALRQVAERGEKRATYRLAAAIQVLYPCAVLILAALIGFFVISMFLPLINLIKALS